MFSLFSTTKDLVMKIDDFIDLVGESVLHFREGMNLYLEKDFEGFQDRFDIIVKVEGKGDDMRRDIEAQLYVQTLIPESREDVLILLEGLDDVIDHAKAILSDFKIETPEIPESLHEKLRKLAGLSVECANALMQASRSYFYDVNSVKDSLHRIKFYESESDYAARKLKEELFEMEIDLARKLHVKNFIRAIDQIADFAEDTSNHLSIAAMKRIV